MRLKKRNYVKGTVSFLDLFFVNKYTHVYIHTITIAQAAIRTLSNINILYISRYGFFEHWTLSVHWCIQLMRCQRCIEDIIHKCRICCLHWFKLTKHSLLGDFFLDSTCLSFTLINFELFVFSINETFAYGYATIYSAHWSALSKTFITL